MSHTLFVNLPTKDLERAKAFFAELGLQSFGMTDDMASIIINDRTQVMLLAEPTFAGYARNAVADPTAATQVILVIAADDREGVDRLADKALAAGAKPVGEPREADGRYQRGFTDLDGHHWEVLCLVQPS
ncbi:VOC family protein [Thermoactinospora rubra]|uniref:VOC family protein n=1 Tax=Thermoactinospora rubra TaxID=1088767 RepID=UPI000A1198A8|nr:VOC family protein [Thermoactinospora rubra]